MSEETLRRDEPVAAMARDEWDERQSPLPREMPATAVHERAPSAPPATAEPATLWPVETVRGFRDRWREIQLRFVDDPRAATGEAEGLLAEVLEVFSETLAAHKAEVDTWGDDGDIERLRTAIRRYRDLVEQILAR